MSDLATQNAEHRAVLAHAETAPRRTRKGRSTYTVTRTHPRRMVGPDPVRSLAWAPDGVSLVDETGQRVDLVRLDGTTLAALADRWIAERDPDHDRPCTCDDLTDTWMVPLRGKRTPRPTDNVVNTAGVLGAGRTYVLRERNVRRCHCRPFPALLGSDITGRMWEEITPRTIAAASWRTRSRTRLPRQRTAEAFATHQVSHSRDTRYPVHGATVMTADDGTGALITGWIDGSAYWAGHVLVCRAASARNGARSARRATERTQRADAIPTDVRDALASLTAIISDTADTTTCQLNGASLTLARPARDGRRRYTITWQTGETTRGQARTLAPIARALCERGTGLA